MHTDGRTAVRGDETDRSSVAQKTERARARTLGRRARARALARHLRSAQSGLVGQLVRFGLAGGIVTLVYLTATTVLSQVIGLPFEAALALGFGIALSLHFTLQRLFVWMHEDGFALPVRHQMGRYLLMAGAQYGCTAASTAVLPSALGLPTETIYLMTAALATTTGFLLMRFVIFHGRAAGVRAARLRRRRPSPPR